MSVKNLPRLALLFTTNSNIKEDSRLSEPKALRQTGWIYKGLQVNNREKQSC
jgi:hypothetical protein